MAKLILQDVRCSYVFITEPRKNKDGTDGSYGVQVLIPKTNKKMLQQIQNAVKEVAKEKFPKVKKLGSLKLPLRDGDEEGEGEHLEGHYFMNANSNRKVGIVNRQGDSPDQADLDEYCFSGAYFHCSINLFGFDTDGNKGVAVGLNNVMLRKKGPRLDGMVSAESEFSDFADDGEGDEDFDDLDDL